MTLPAINRYLATSGGILKQSDLALFLQAPITGLSGFSALEQQAVLAWGKKDNTQAACEFAKQQQLPLYRLEDGFLGYFGHPAKRCIRVGLSYDRQGIYYDALAPSQLEQHIAQPLTDTERTYSQQTLALWQTLALSKYNDPKLWPAATGKPIAANEHYVLLVDQTFGDKSLQLGAAQQQSFLWMLLDALNLYPDAQIRIRTHPDVLAGKKQGCFEPSWLQISERIVLDSQPILASELIQQAQAVFCVTSQLGLEAMLHNKRVYTYAVSFYSGYQLTQDRLGYLQALTPQEVDAYFALICEPLSQHSISLELPPILAALACYTKKQQLRCTDDWLKLSQQQKIQQLFFACFESYALYLHPDTQQPCELLAILNWFALQQSNVINTEKKLLLQGFSFWKRCFIPAFLPFKQRNNLVFASMGQQVQYADYDVVLTWGQTKASQIRPYLKQQQLICIEDGFIRSHGLGVQLKKPNSLCLDDLGIYYNNQSVSRLESILATSDFSQQQCQQAQSLLQSIEQQAISKYNVGAALEASSIEAIAKARSNKQSIILIPGQVMGDASLLFGGESITSNSQLIKQVRQDYPDAFLIYKPHPDVFASSKGDQSELALAQQCCQLVLIQQDITQLYPQVDRVCTMTSLSGFEALLRGVQVSCYGMPFYAGWGLTQDYISQQRRQRQLSLVELVAAVLIAYPTYVNWRTWTFMHPQHALQQIHSEKQQQATKKLNSKWLNKLRYLLESINMRRKHY